MNAAPILDADLHDFLPRVLPAGWRTAQRTADGASYFATHLGLFVIVSGARELDGRRWLHVSVSRCMRDGRSWSATRTEMPSWDDLRVAKDVFVGLERKAVQVLPPQSEYVNIHPHVLHLWACLDGDVLPDFTHGSGSL